MSFKFNFNQEDNNDDEINTENDNEEKLKEFNVKESDSTVELDAKCCHFTVCNQN